MTVSLSDEARRAIALAEDVAGVTVTDCLIEDDDHVVFVVKAGEIDRAIGTDGRTVRRIEERLGRDVTLVEDAPTPETFLANALAPAAVEAVTIEDTDEGTVAEVAVDDRDRGLAIGSDGRNIDRARRLLSRHFDVEDVRLD